MFAPTFRFATLAGACVLASCATLPDTPPAGNGRPPRAAAPSAQAIASAQRLAGAPGSAPAAATPSTLRSFADVSKDAKELPGLFRMWQKDDKVWLEIEPSQFDQRVFFSTNLDQGLGENGFYGGSMSSSLSRRFGSPVIVDVPQGRHQRPADRQEREVHGPGGHARGARGGRCLFGQPHLQRRHRVAAAPGTQVGAGGGEFAVLRRPSGRGDAPRADAIGRRTLSMRATRSSGRCAARRRSFR